MKKTRKQPSALLKDSLKYQKTSTLLLSSLHQNFGFSYYVNLRNAKRIQVNVYLKNQGGYHNHHSTLHNFS